MKKALRGMDKILLILTILMLAFGLLAIFSSSTAMATIAYNNPYRFVLRQSIFIFTGSLIFLFLINVPTQKYYKWGKISVIATILLLALLFIYGETTRSARSWLNINTFGIQPSEFIKMFLLVYLATSYEKIITRNISQIKKVLKPLGVVLITLILVLLQPDLGTMIIIAGMVFLIFLSLPLDKKIKKTVFSATVLTFSSALLIILLAPPNGSYLNEKLERFNFIEPCSRYQESSGYQVCNGYIAINNGGLSGVGIGASTQKHLYLPEAHTDFIYPVIVEEYGSILSGFVLLAYLLILTRLVLISKRSHTLRGSIIAYGVAAYIAMHIFINLLGVLGLIPLTGVPLPFLSYGGSNLWTLMIGLAIAQRVAIETSIHNKKIILKKSTRF